MMDDHDGIGWPRTYFVWGWISGALAIEGGRAVFDGLTGIGLFTVLLSVVAWAFARWATQPLFGRGI